MIFYLLHSYLSVLGDGAGPTVLQALVSVSFSSRAQAQVPTRFTHHTTSIALYDRIVLKSNSAIRSIAGRYLWYFLINS